MARSAISGIYSITHKADGKVYVGQSRDIAKRIRHHRDYDQDCTHLCNAINLYGWDAFEVAVLEEVDDYNLLNDREQYWMDTLEAYNPKKGYNILRWADGKATRTKPEAMETTKAQLVTFEAPTDLLARFDKVVASRYTNRSALLRELMAREIDALVRSQQEPQEAA